MKVAKHKYSQLKKLHNQAMNTLRSLLQGPSLNFASNIKQVLKNQLTISIENLWFSDDFKGNRS